MTGHAPVMLAEVVAALAPEPGDVIVDATFGGGGYTRAILAAADCQVIAVDRDPDAVARAQALAAESSRLSISPGPFGDMAERIEGPVRGVVFDFGVSSFQLDEAERGFSFRFDAPLDMRMGKAGPSAADAVNGLSEAALADVIFHYGEEPGARRVARAIVDRRKDARIDTTGALADIVERALGGRRGAKLHPATRAFQALRILVNDELGEIARGLAAAESLLGEGGRLVTVAFHSLEDRLVKRFLAARSGAEPSGSRFAPRAEPVRPPSFRLKNKSALAPLEAEAQANPRARSAKLRSALRTESPPWGAFAPSPALPPRSQAEWEALA